VFRFVAGSAAIVNSGTQVQASLRSGKRPAGLFWSAHHRARAPSSPRHRCTRPYGRCSHRKCNVSSACNRMGKGDRRPSWGSRVADVAHFGPDTTHTNRIARSEPNSTPLLRNDSIPVEKGYDSQNGFELNTTSALTRVVLLKYRESPPA